MSARTETVGTVDWTTVAVGWDRHRAVIERTKAALTERLLQCIALRPGDRVLELGAGTGDLARRISAEVGPAGTVTATDVASGMVELIAGTTADLSNVDVKQVDAAAIALPDASYDAIVFRMGPMFVVPPLDSLREIRRVLAPGGRIAVTTWAAAEHNMWLAAVGMAAMVHGLLNGPDPTQPGGPLSLSDPAALEQLAREAGFGSAAATLVDLTFEVSGVDEHLAHVTALAPPLKVAFAAATPEQRSAVRSTLEEVTSQFLTDGGGLVIPARALLLEAH
jgi:SAM-dependent methyltransferase